MNGEPWILFIRDSFFFSMSMYLEKALRKRCNVVSIYVDELSSLYYLGGRPMGPLAKPLTKRMLNRFLKGKSWLPEVDAILVSDPVLVPLDFSELDIPTAFYAMDPYSYKMQHVRRTHVESYDHVFVTQKDDVQFYKEAGCAETIWLPLAADPDIHRPMAMREVYDLCFVGTPRPGSQRQRFLNEVKKKLEGRHTYFGGAFLRDMVRIHNSSKTILNRSNQGDLTMRVFEALACGRLLFTDRISNGLQDLFTDKRHLLIYDDLDDFVELFEHYVDRDDERARIGHEGQKEVNAKHTYDQRVDEILKAFKLTNAAPPPPSGE
jgi:spore maturation protein CgeB